MNWIEAKITFTSPDPTIAMDLISDIFYELGLSGVVIEEPGVVPADGAPTFKKPADYAVIGYLPEDESVKESCRTLESELFRMKETLNIQYNVAYGKTAEKDWAESWKAFFKPEKISPRLVVKPTWQPYPRKQDEIILEIDPGMAFGTGTHPTTVLCLQMIEHYLKPGDTFLDVGTGSGILMVAAAKLGASRMMGIDKDSTAVKIAEKNMLINGVAPDVFHTLVAHLMETVTGRYQVVVANILTETVLALLKGLGSVLADEGIFILSGITDDNADRVRDRVISWGFKHLETRRQDGWVALAGKRF